MPSQKRKLGDIGENIVKRWLEKKGYRLVDSNYLKKWGEADVIAKKGDTLHFFEIKTRNQKYVGHYPTEYSINPTKRRKLQKICETYLAEKQYPADQKWQINLIAVEIDFSAKKAKIRRLDNVVWEQRY